MELSYDWRSFQSVFFPAKRAALHHAASEIRTPIYLITEHETIACAFSEYEDLSRWIGQSYKDLALELPHRELILFNRDKVDQALQSSLALPHYYDQIEFLRSEGGALRMAEAAKKAGVPAGKLKLKTPKPFHLKPGTREVAPRHFLLEALQGWWAKLLPSSYGVHLRLMSDPGKGIDKLPKVSSDLFLIFRRGRIDSFYIPDFGPLSKERSADPSNVAKYLSEKHLLPVQGIVVAATEWAEWTASPNPWRQIAAAVRKDRVQLYPFRWGVTFLLAARAFFGL
jgi:hypothetical protein